MLKNILAFTFILFLNTLVIAEETNTPTQVNHITCLWQVDSAYQKNTGDGYFVNLNGPKAIHFSKEKLSKAEMISSFQKVYGQPTVRYTTINHFELVKLSSAGSPAAVQYFVMAAAGSITAFGLNEAEFLHFLSSCEKIATDNNFNNFEWKNK